MKEKEGHYYICSCGCFYKVINGKQIRQEICELKHVNDNNFHKSEFHKTHLKSGGEVMHGVKRKVKKIT